MQTLYLATHFNPVYWNTACLIVNSGALEIKKDKQESTDYAKIAKAISAIRAAGVKVSLIDINNSTFGFFPDVENNQILFGMKGMLNVGDDIISEIIAHRPYTSPRDFLNKVNPNKLTMISLIKGGAFDEMMDRRQTMAWYLWETCDKKSRLTLQNMPTLIANNLIPEDDENLAFAKRVFEFNRYLKAMCKFSTTQYLLDERAINFILELNMDELIDSENKMNIKSWDKVYQKLMDIMRNWLKANNDSILQELNDRIFMEDWKKYAKKGTVSSWEMEVLCFYYHDHELKDVNQSKYGLSNFFDLPKHPIVEKTFKKGGKDINIYKLHKICGTCIAKNKNKSTVSLLTPYGVVDVKFRKEYFSLFDKRISAVGEDGKKHVIENSWFNRGSMILVQGIRNEDSFITKKYASSPGHQLYKIIDVKDNGDLVLQDARYKGDLEDEP